MCCGEEMLDRLRVREEGVVLLGCHLECAVLGLRRIGQRDGVRLVVVLDDRAAVVLAAELRAVVDALLHSILLEGTGEGHDHHTPYPS